MIGLSAQGRSHILIDKKIYSLYGTLLNLQKIGLSKYLIDVKEKNKSIESVAKYTQFLLRRGVHKNHTIVVIGGGLVQDIGSFTSHILLRGIDWIFFPTTLLSMSDSCIGAKSGINVGKYKNQIGSFHPPKRIYIILNFLKTLPRDMIFDGNGEIIKHAIIKGGQNFEYLTKHLSEIQYNKQIASRIIYDSLLVKKDIIEEDEFDKGRRKLLNYGHTFGHALEGYTKNKIMHGVAVSIGMDIANYISLKRGLLSQKEFDRMSQILHKNIPYENLPIKNMDSYMDFIWHDKKVINNEVFALLCRGIGKVEIVRVGLDNNLRRNISDYIVSYHSLRSRAFSV